MHLLYIADPLCSWCYGFGPELARVVERHPGARVELLMGGLRPFNREPPSAAFKAMLREHWDHVAAASGLAFDPAVLDRAGFVYDTEPPCRAVVAARHLDAARALAYLKAVQLAFYRDARDATDGAVLADVAQESGYERAAFEEAFAGEAMREATRRDFARTQAMGVAGFPTLGVAHGGQLYLVTSGFVTADVLEHRLGEIERLVAPRAP